LAEPRAWSNPERIPLFDEEKQQKTLIPALRRPNATLQVLDSIWVQREFRYADEQRNLAADQGN
jgi:hypothetical protein